MAFLGLPPRCSKRSAEEGINEVGGLMTGARDKILSRDCGRRSPAFLLARPELTAAEISRELERLYPERYRPTQARTLRRGVQKLRARLLVTFDDQWGEELVNGQSPTPALRAEVVGAVS